MRWVPSLLAALRGGHGAWQGLPVAPTEGSTPPVPEPLLLDASTRTFWSPGAVAPATLVEAAATSAAPPSRVTELMSAGDRPPREGRPRGNPAFSEALFVELMCARQYGRAYELLTPDCQRSWGSVEAFAAALGGSVPRGLAGVEVREVRFLAEWVDPEERLPHRDVAELDVEYVLSRGERRVTVPKTVHLVAVEGRWRSLCYPPRAMPTG